jgi:ribosomal protein L37AE/L43A
MKEELKVQKIAAQQLTEEEKVLPRGDLEKKWQEDRYVKRFGPRESTTLTEDERQLSKAQLYKKLVQERRDKWIQEQRDRGIAIWECENCGRWEKNGTQHHCIRGQYRGPLQRRGGVPIHSQMIVEGTPAGFNIRQQPVIDYQKLQKEHATMTKALEELQSVQSTMKFNPAVIDQTMTDVNQQTATSSGLSRAANVSAITTEERQSNF